MLDMKIGMQLQQELVSKNGTSSVLLRSINFILAALTGRGRFFFFFFYPFPLFSPGTTVLAPKQIGISVSH